MDALLSTSAFQLLGGTGDGWTAFFVFIVEAVVVSVADPGLRDAVAGTRAGKLKIDARPLSAKIYKNFRQIP